MSSLGMNYLLIPVCAVITLGVEVAANQVQVTLFYSGKNSDTILKNQRASIENKIPKLCQGLGSQ